MPPVSTLSLRVVTPLFGGFSWACWLVIGGRPACLPTIAATPMETWSEVIVATSDVAEQVEALRQIEPSKHDDE